MREKKRWLQQRSWGGQRKRRTDTKKRRIFVFLRKIFVLLKKDIFFVEKDIFPRMEEKEATKGEKKREEEVFSELRE